MSETPAERSRRSRLKRIFNITPEEYDAVLKYQEGVCAICESPPGKTRLAVDHDHKTGLVRGLVCWQCNSALAKLKDSPARAYAAWAYLTRPPFSVVLGEDRFGVIGRVTNKRRKTTPKRKAERKPPVRKSVASKPKPARKPNRKESL